MRNSRSRLGLILLGGLVGLVRAEPTWEAARAAAEELARLEETFLVQTASVRLTFLCLGHFAEPEQQKVLNEAVRSARQRTQEILELFSQMNKQMTEYTGSDWDALYGQTGVWSAVQRGLLQGQYLQTVLLFWAALCEQAPRRQELLTQVIEDCRSDHARWLGQEQILEVRARQYRQAAEDAEQLRMILHQMMLRSDLSGSAHRGMLLLQKRFELFSGGPFEEEAARIFQQTVSAKEDFEWAIEYAFFELTRGRQEPLQEVRQAWPQSEEFIAGLLCAQEAEKFETVERPALEARMQQFAVRASRSRDPNERDQVEQQWMEWIQSIDRSTSKKAALRKEAAAGYVSYLFERPDKENVEKIVRFLEREADKGEPVLGYLYVQALSLKADYGRAVEVLCAIPADCRNGAFDLYVLEAFAERREDYSGVSESMVKKRAEQIAACGDTAGQGRKRAQLIWAEMAARSSQLSPEEETRLERFLEEQKDSSDERVFRCRAFRRMQQGRWPQAVKEWQRIRSAFEPSDRTRKDRSWPWWRAKYYELYCSAQLSERSREDVRHAVRVLRALYAPPPPVWDERLRELDK